MLCWGEQTLLHHDLTSFVKLTLSCVLDIMHMLSGLLLRFCNGEAVHRMA